MIKVGSLTPWGEAQRIELLAPGIQFISTGSHGGIYIDGAHINQLPDAAHAANFMNRRPFGVGFAKIAWWERDCDWCIPYVFFWNEIREHAERATRDGTTDGTTDGVYQRAIEILRRWFPNLASIILNESEGK
jgi:hypothetical protein